MIKWIIIALIGLIILGYLGFDIKKAVEAPVSQSNVEYVKNIVVYVWNTYLAKPAKYLWNDIFIRLIWTTAIDNLTKIKNGEPTNIQTSSPQLPAN
jgi:hypothetical protein